MEELLKCLFDWAQQAPFEQGSWSRKPYNGATGCSSFDAQRGEGWKGDWGAGKGKEGGHEGGVKDVLRF